VLADLVLVAGTVAANRRA